MKDTALAIRYAKALFELACRKKIELKVEENLKAFWHIIQARKELALFFDHPMLGLDEKKSILKNVIGENIELLSLQFLNLLTVKNHVGLLSSILESYHRLLNESRHFEEVEITTARALSAKLKESLEKILEKKIGEKIISKTTINPKFIGGVSVRIRNRLFDGSIRTKLDGLKLQMAGLKS